MKLLVLCLLLLAIMPFAFAEDCDTFCKDKIYISGVCRFDRAEFNSCEEGEVEFANGECVENHTVCCCKKKPECDTCLVGEECLALGEIKDDTYCSSNQSMVEQKSENESCSNNYECSTNYCKDGICKQICDGCETDSKCLNIGEIYEDKYCSEDKSMEGQKKEGESCKENYECVSDLCEEGKCKIPCDGCEKDGQCLKIGENFSEGYCQEDMTLQAFKEKGMECKYDYECLDEICSEGKCGKLSLITRMLNWIKGLFS